MSDFERYRPEIEIYTVESPAPVSGTVANYHNNNFKVIADGLVTATTTLAAKLDKSGGTLTGGLNMGSNGITNVTTINGGTIEIQGNKNQPNGYPGLDSSGDLVGRIIVRYDTYSNLSSILLSAGELAIASDTGILYRGDGVTMPGKAIGGGQLTTITSTAYGSTFAPITHNGADVVLLDLSATDTNGLVGFVQSATDIGMQAGVYTGQRITLIIKLSSITTTPFAGCVTTLSLQGTNFKWTQEKDLGGTGVTPGRGFQSPVTTTTTGTATHAQILNLVWSGTAWCDASPSSGSRQNRGGLAAGNNVSSPSLGIAVGDNVLGSTGAYSALFGQAYTCNGSWNLVSGLNHAGISTITTSLIVGESNKVTGSLYGGLLVFGSYGIARTKYSMVQGAGAGLIGSAQSTQVTMTLITSNATQKALTSDANTAVSTNQIIVPPQATLSCRFEVALYNQTTAGGGSIIGRASAWRDASGVVTLLGVTTEESILSSSLTGCSVTCTVSQTTKALEFKATGLASNTIWWTARVTTSEVSMVAQ
jgi:hypothetical protein